MPAQGARDPASKQKQNPKSLRCQLYVDSLFLFVVAQLGLLLNSIGKSSVMAEDSVKSEQTKPRLGLHTESAMSTAAWLLILVLCHQRSGQSFCWTACLLSRVQSVGCYYSLITHMQPQKTPTMLPVWVGLHCLRQPWRLHLAGLSLPCIVTVPEGGKHACLQSEIQNDWTLKLLSVSNLYVHICVVSTHCVVQIF